MTHKHRTRIILGSIAALTLVAAFFVLNRPESSASVQQTDDAYVRADLTVIVPEVSGVIREVSVEDNQRVEAGAPLVRIDERQLRVVLATAQAHVVAAQANLDGMQARIVRQQSLVAEARAAITASSANIKLAEANRSRFANLARDGSGTLQAQQQAETQWETQRAALARDRASLQSVEQQTAVLQANLEGARGALQSAQAEQAAAELNLSHARMTAPVGGIVAQRAARVGGYARAGEPLLTLVPLDTVYIEASYRETQLAHVRAGQSVDISVDALPGVRLKGRVESLAPASGASFSTVPAHNATGNFTKIVQRLPVRIRIEAGQQDAQRLRVGMSVRPSIHLDAKAS